MSILKTLKTQTLAAKILFWTGQVIGIIYGLFLLLFAGGNVIVELSEEVMTIREDYIILVFLISLVGFACAIILTWFKSKTGAYLMLGFAILGIAFMLKYSAVAILVSSPLLVSGILLLLFAYLKKDEPS